MKECYNTTVKFKAKSVEYIMHFVETKYVLKLPSTYIFCAAMRSLIIYKQSEDKIIFT